MEKKMKKLILSILFLSICFMQMNNQNGKRQFREWNNETKSAGSLISLTLFISRQVTRTQDGYKSEGFLRKNRYLLGQCPFTDSLHL